MIVEFDLRRAAILAELRAFLAGAAGHDFEPVSWREAYGFILELQRRFPYDRLGRVDRGGVRAYPQQTTGFSRAQITPTDRAIPGHRRPARPARPLLQHDLAAAVHAAEVEHGLRHVDAQRCDRLFHDGSHRH